jgi:hypothetical protein
MLKDAQCKLACANAIASTAILASEHFPRPTNEWEAKPCNQKTWTAWKTHYRAAHLPRKQLLLASGCSTATQGMAHIAMFDTTIQPDTLDRLN